MKKMKKKLKLIMSILLLTSTIAQSQNKWNVVKQAKGDLNKDNIADYVIVSEYKKSNDETVYSLQIFFTKRDGSFTKILTTNKVIEPSSTESGIVFGDVTIQKGVITLSVDLMRGNYASKFRLQNGKFELIGYDEQNCGAATDCESISYNAITGVRIIKQQSKETDQILSTTKEIVKIQPLPNLKDFTQEDFTRRLFPEY
jgi:hypothetical protein